MSHPASRRVSALHSTRSRRLIVILMVAGMGALLTAPATAGAHVNPKYRAQYKATLDSYDRMFHRYMRGFALKPDSITSLADQMQPLIGDEDPVVRADLLGIEHQTRIVRDDLETVTVAWDKMLDRSFHGFRSKAYRWLDAKRDRKRFPKQADLMDISFSYLLTVGAYPELSQAALMLSNDPTDLSPAPQMIAKAADTAKTAHTDFHEALAALKKLK